MLGLGLGLGFSGVKSQAFDPASIPGLVFSLNAKNDSITVVGGKITKLLDASGNGHDFDPTSASIFVQTASDSDFNGQPSIVLPGTDYFASSAAVPMACPFTRVFVCAITADGNGYLWYNTDGGSINFDILISRSGAYTDYVQRNSSDYLIKEADNFAPATAATIVWTSDGTAAGTTIYVNGSVVSEAINLSSGTTAFGSYSHILDLFSNTATIASGKFAAILAYDHQLSAVDLAKLQTGLQSLYKTW